jgi:hypothetical protein
MDSIIIREARRLVDIVQRRDSGDTVTCHYLIIERPNLYTHGPAATREIEQYRDLERVVANALDCETGDRNATWRGAFSATYTDGVLVETHVVDLAPLIAAERQKRPEQRVRRIAGRLNVLRLPEVEAQS